MEEDPVCGRQVEMTGVTETFGYMSRSFWPEKNANIAASESGPNCGAELCG